MTLTHYSDAIAHGERLALIMRNENKTNSNFALNAL